MKFRVIPIGEVEADIKRVYDAGGKFNAASEYENLHFISFHVWGVLPRDMDKMQIKLDNIISEYSSKKDVKSIIDPDSKFEIKSAY